MSRARETGIITCPHDAMGNPRPPVTTTRGETWVIKGMKAKSLTGVTTRDFLGADLRHYIRALKHKGIGIRDEWETDAFGRHKRWFLNEGHEIEIVPEKQKPAGGNLRALNQNSRAECEGLNDERV